MSSSHLTRIPPQSGRSFKIKRGQILRVVDPFGEQVSDLFAFDEHDYDCRLSSGRSLDYASRIYLTTGDELFSNRSNVMARIVADDVGHHDFLLTPCSKDTFRIILKLVHASGAAKVLGATLELRGPSAARIHFHSANGVDLFVKAIGHALLRSFRTNSASKIP